MQMCPEYENSHFSHISFQHGYLTYCSTYKSAKKMVCIFLRCIWRKECLKFLIKASVFVLLYKEDGN